MLFFSNLILSFFPILPLVLISGYVCSLESHPDIIACLVHRGHNFRTNLGALHIHDSGAQVHENRPRTADRGERCPFRGTLHL